MWLLSPSGWPTHADSAEEQADLTGRGYTPISEGQVQAAIDAFNAGTAPPAGVELLSEAAAAAKVTGTGPLAVALKGAFGRAAPVLSDFVYDAPTGNLLSYKEDGIPIVLTYNSDGTVATMKRGDGAAQTFAYSGGNLAGVA